MGGGEGGMHGDVTNVRRGRNGGRRRGGDVVSILDHRGKFVLDARKSGLSWKEISTSLGISISRAQQIATRYYRMTIKADYQKRSWMVLYRLAWEEITTLGVEHGDKGGVTCRVSRERV